MVVTHDMKGVCPECKKSSNYYSLADGKIIITWFSCGHISIINDGNIDVAYKIEKEVKKL